jgi:hypothetical protein
MPFNIEVCLIANSRERIDRNADIDLYDAMAPGAGQVVMMAIAADTVVMGAIGKLDTIQQAHIDQHLHRAVDGCPAEARLYLAQFLPEIVNREIAAACSKLDKALGNQPARARVALAQLMKCRMNFIRNHL